VFLKAAAARRVESKEKRLVHRKNNMPEAYVYTSESFWTHSTPQCDQLQPSCSRCARLFIPCSGGGVQRYVFLDNSGPGGKAQQFKEFLSRRDALINAPTQAVGSIPPNSQDSMTALMVNKFSITDLRYDVSWAFGPFIHEIPRRVEHSVALDFAARTFVLSLPPSPHTRRHPGSDVLENFSAALKETRLALADPVASKSTNTLCAVYLLALCTASL
jgi:hypothetical protein